MTKIELAKGTKNIEPEQRLIRNKIINIITKTFELYGYSPLETPTLQKFDVLASKYAGGAEILKETFKVNDQGGRDLALRYDLTVPLSLYVALNPQVKLPFKRYEIGKVFRDGPISSVRFREFWQCDADIVGSSSILVDAECVNLFSTVFKELNLDVVIKVNNRKILDGVMNYSNIPDNLRDSVILTIDKLDKIGVDGIKKELKEKNILTEQINKLTTLIDLKGSNKEKLSSIKKLLKENEGVKEFEELIKYAPQIEFDLTLARGLSYYTGSIFEIKVKNSDMKVTVASGGRYDNMIGDFLGNGQKYPAVGISFGLDRIELLMKSEGKTLTKVYVIPIKQAEKAAELVQELRDNEINSDMDLMDRGVSKSLDYVNTLGIPYVIFVGEDEVKKNKFKLRDMKTGKEELLDIKNIVNKLQ